MYFVQNQRIAILVKYRPLIYTFLAIFISLTATFAYAQDEDTDENTDEVTEEEATFVDPLEAARAKGGDILMMKSGAIMSGVQIIRSSPTQYEVEILPGMEPMKIPRRQVKMVEMDNIDPLRERRLRESMPKPEDELMTGGKELDPAFVEKLKKPIPGAPLIFDKEDYVTVFAKLAQKTKVEIIIDPALKKLLPAQRLWTLKITEKTTLMEILQKKWATDFKTGKVTYELNKVILKEKGAETPVVETPATNAPATAQVAPRPAFKFNR